MMWEMRRRKSKPTLLLNQGIFNVAHHICIACEELAFDNAVIYTKCGNRLQHNYMVQVAQPVKCRVFRNIRVSNLNHISNICVISIIRSNSLSRFYTCIVRYTSNIYRDCKYVCLLIVVFHPSNLLCYFRTASDMLVGC